MVLNGPTNGAARRVYVEKVLMDLLSAGEIVVMENHTTRNADGLRIATEAAGASSQLLPPYRPDLNPIEMAFSKLRPLMQVEAERALKARCRAIGMLIPLFKPAECAN